PAPNSSGTTVTRIKYDDRENPIEGAFFDADGRPAYDVEGTTRIVRRYDERGNEIENENFGLDGQPGTTNDGDSRRVHEYESQNNEPARTYFGPDGNPVVIARDVDRNNVNADLRSLAYARIERRYDQNGNLIYEAYFDVNKHPMAGPNGYASWTAT